MLAAHLNASIDLSSTWVYAIVVANKARQHKVQQSAFSRKQGIRYWLDFLPTLDGDKCAKNRS